MTVWWTRVPVLPTENPQVIIPIIPTNLPIYAWIEKNLSIDKPSRMALSSGKPDPSTSRQIYSLFEIFK